MKIDVIGFDADDTLWDYEILYHQAKPEVMRLFGADLDPDSLGNLLDNIEVDNLPLYGYGIKSYALSMIEAFTKQADGPIDKENLAELINVFKTMLTTKLKINLYAKDTLAELSNQYRLMLLTKGDLHEQERKIQQSGLTEYFDYIEIVSQKKEANYRNVLAKYDIAPAHFLMVGNSLKSDVLPVVRIGSNAVYIPHADTWIHELVPVPDVDEDQGYTQLEHLGLLPDHLQALSE